MIGILIFVIVVFIYYEYAHSLSQDSGEITSDLVMDAKAISGALVTKGSPNHWNESNVTVIGLTDGRQRLMQEKLDVFADMDYQKTKTKLRTSYDFYVYFEYLNGTKIVVDGGEDIGINPNGADNIVTLTRLLLYDSKLISMVVQVWD
jgi:hypothetical protein